MGGNLSVQTINEYVDNSVELKTIIKNSIKSTNNTSVSTINAQDFSFINGGTKECCIFPGTEKVIPNCIVGSIDCDNFNISQKINGNITIISKTDSKLTMDIMDKLKQKVQNDITHALATKQEGGLSIGPNMSVQQSNKKIDNSIKQLFESTNNVELVNSLLVNTVNRQSQKIVNCSSLKGNNCNMSQDIALELMTTNILSNLTEIAKKDETFTDIINTLKTKASADQSNALLGGFGQIIMIIILVIVLIIIGFLVYKMIQNKQQANQPMPMQGYPRPMQGYPRPIQPQYQQSQPQYQQSQPQYQQSQPQYQQSQPLYQQGIQRLPSFVQPIAQQAVNTALSQPFVQPIIQTLPSNIQSQLSYPVS